MYTIYNNRLTAGQVGPQTDKLTAQLGEIYKVSKRTVKDFSASSEVPLNIEFSVSFSNIILIPLKVVIRVLLFLNSTPKRSQHLSVPRWNLMKPNKNRKCSDSYHPIALTSCVSKIFEQLLKQRLEFYIESNCILPKNQFAFRRSYSARESVGCLYIDLHKALIENNILACIFFDIVGAFNNINLSILRTTLSSIGIPSKVVCWINYFLSRRQVFVKFNNKLYGPQLSYEGYLCRRGIFKPTSVYFVYS